MKRLTNFLFALVLTAALTSCIYDFTNHEGASGAVLSNNGKDNKITSLSALIDQTPEDGTINLSEYADITDYSASINKAVTINAGNIDMNDCSLSINESGVILNGLNNANVSANPGIGNGSLKISGSSLNSLNIFGGGLNSIHLLNGTTITGKTIIGKEYNAAQNDQEPVRLVMDSTIIIADLTIKSSAVLDSGTSEVNDDNLRSVIFDIDVTNAESSVNVAVSANLTFTTPQQTNFARVQFQSSTVSDARMDIFVMKKNETVTINKDFFTDAFQRLIGDVTKDEIETEFSAYIGHSITESDISSPISVDNLIEPVTVTLYYYNGDEAENFTFAKGKKLDISAQGKTKDGYVFRGWSTDIGAEEADPELTAGEFVTVNEDKTFYFVWKKDETTATTIPYVEYDGNFTKWCFSGNIADISDKWDGSSTAPTFGILFMDSQTINEMMNLDIEILKDGNRTNRWLFNRPSGNSVYQLVRKNDNGIENLTFSTNQIGTYKTRYEGLIYSIVDENKYAIYLDKEQINKTDIWAFGQGYSKTYDVSGDTVTKNEQQLTNDDALNLAGYIPIVLALSDNSHDPNYLTQFWRSSMIRMSPYKGELPTYEGSVAGLEAWFASHNNPITDFYLTITDTVPDMTSDSAKTAFAACPSSFTLDLSKCTAFSSVNQNTTLRGNPNLKKVILPSSVTDIQGGFIECPSLTEVVIDNGSFKSENGIVFSNNSTNRSIVLYPSGKQAYSYTIPDGVTTIGSNAFKSNNYLRQLEISEGVTTIMGGAFASMSNLTNITIPASVMDINDNVFNSCDKLETITVADGNANYKSVADILFKKDNAEDLVTLIHYPAAKSDTSYEIPSTVTVLSPDAFLNCKNLESITLPDNLKTIDRNAFFGCINLTSIKPASTTETADLVLPNTVTDIRQNAFNGCSKLSSVILLSITPPSLGGDVFTGCTLANIYVPADKVTEYQEASGWSAYAEKISGISGGTGSGGTTTAFDPSNSNYDAILAGLDYDESYDVSVSDLSAWLTEHTATDKIYRVKITDANPDMNTFKGLMKGYVSDPRKISLDLWDCTGLSTIVDAVFDEWHSLVNIILPKNISNVTEYGIGYCPNLKNVYVDNGNMLFYSEDGVLFNKNKTELIKYPSAKENTTYTILDTVTSINSYAFSYASHLESVTIPSSVVSIGDSAFMQSGLTTLSISSGAIKIFNSAFEKCEQLENVTIQSSVTFFGDGVFAYCNNLKSITLSDTDSELSLDNKGVLFNKDKTKLICYPAGKDTVDTTYDIPTSVTEIGPCAFARSFKLNKVTINSDISTIGDFAFSECYCYDNSADNPFTLIMNDSTPPVLGQDIFLYIDNVSIQVPNGSVDTYKTSWSGYEDKIQAISSNP